MRKRYYDYMKHIIPLLAHYNSVDHRGAAIIITILVLSIKYLKGDLFRKIDQHFTMYIMKSVNRLISKTKYSTQFFKEKKKKNKCGAYNVLKAVCFGLLAASS